jgi:Co/Zn/Cd efflux system component
MALPNWIDLLVVVLFSLVIFYYAVSLAMDSEHVNAAVEREKRQIEEERELNLPG